MKIPARVQIYSKIFKNDLKSCFIFFLVYFYFKLKFVYYSVFLVVIFNRKKKYFFNNFYNLFYIKLENTLARVLLFVFT